jgi:tetratricopeptide (TPR) repeat protein
MKTATIVAIFAFVFSAASASAIVSTPQPPTTTVTPDSSTLLPSDDPLQTPQGKMAEAARNKLTAERKAVAEELGKSLQFDPDKVKAALKDLDEGVDNSPEDNVDRAAKALARIDPNFAKAHDFVAKGKWADAAAALGDALADEKPGYQAALKRLLLGDCLQKQGRTKEAAAAWEAVLNRMPERLSFAYLAGLRLAEAYEKMDHPFYALTIYKYWMQNYGFLDFKTAQGLMPRVQQLAADYGDPLGTAAEKMTDVGTRLKGIDSGQETQTVEKRIVAILDDLIKAAEDQQNQGKGQGQGQGQGQGMGQGTGAPRGNGRPSSPATASSLPLGDTARPDSPLSKTRPSDGSDDWGKLKPREKQELIEAFKEMYPERYREMLEAYYKNLAETENRR